MLAVGIDIGGTSIKGAVVNDLGEVLTRFHMDVDKNAKIRRTSRAIGPKIRVPIGSKLFLFIKTTALSSKRILDPSGRYTGNFVLTIIAR